MLRYYVLYRCLRTTTKTAESLKPHCGKVSSTSLARRCGHTAPFPAPRPRSFDLIIYRKSHVSACSLTQHRGKRDTRREVKQAARLSVAHVPTLGHNFRIQRSERSRLRVKLNATQFLKFWSFSHIFNRRRARAAKGDVHGLLWAGRSRFDKNGTKASGTIQQTPPPPGFCGFLRRSNATNR